MSKKLDQPLNIHRVTIHPPQLHDTQPNDGWGLLCVGCKHVFSDDKKYVTMSPAFPCQKVRYVRLGVQTPGLQRYVDDTESCQSFEVS
jgi:hypothetical protein